MTNAANTDFAVTIVGRDRVGIVAAVACALYETGSNIEDSQMAILQGHFAMMLVVSTVEGVTERALEVALNDVKSRLDLEAVTVRAISHVDNGAPAATLVLTVYGADHPGIVAAFSNALAEKDVNITDLDTRLVGDADNRLYVMLLELAPPAALSFDEIDEALSEVSRANRVEVSLRRLDADAL